MKKMFFIFFALANVCFSSNFSEEENLFLRRIVDFCEEGEKDLATKEIQEYLDKNEKNDFFDFVYALLADIYLSEDNFEDAFQNYSKIEKRKIKEKIFINYLNSAYRLGKFDLVIQEAKEYEDYINSRDRDSFYEVSFMVGDSFLQKALALNDEGYAKTAIRYFASLLGSFYRDEAMESLAYAYEFVKEYKKACEIYVSLGKKDKKEDFLFKAACVYSKFDKDEAIKIFSQISHLDGKKAKEAAFNEMVLLMEEKRYEDFILKKEKLEKYLKEDKSFLFFQGKSHFMLKDYKRAFSCLKEFLKEKEACPMAKNSLEMVVFCAERLHLEELFDFAQNKYEELFPEDEDLFKLYFVKALFHKKNKDYQKAKKMFDLIEQKFPHREDEDYMLEAAHFYYEIKDYLLARIRFKSFIDKYTDPKKVSKCWGYFIDSSIKMLDKVSEDKKDACKSVLIKDLEEFLEREDSEELSVLLCQLKFDLKDYEEALADMISFFEKYPKLKENAKANLLIAMCYDKTGGKKEFCIFLERALFLDKDKLLDEYNIRSNLFNIYIAEKENEKAADHLFHMQKIDSKRVLLENILWLGDFYYQKLKKEKNLDLCERGITVLEKRDIPKEDLLKLSYFYGCKKDFQKRKTLLEKLLLDIEKDTVEIKERVFFDMAINCQNLNLEDKAIIFFDKVISFNKNSYYKYYSLLHSSRIKISKINEEDFHLENPEIIKNLRNLKNLKLQKYLQYEPLHLEAAFDYVDIQTKIKKDKEKRIDLLLNIKKDFLSEDDIISKEYHHMKKSYPLKEKILNAYMLLIDAEIFLYSKKREDFLNALKKIEEELLADKYLKKRFKKLKENYEKSL